MSVACRPHSSVHSPNSGSPPASSRPAAARAYIWSKVRENYYGYGIRTWWLDACEPELVPEQPENVRYHLGPGAEVSTIYPMLHVRGFYEGMRAEGEEEILSLCRSAWAGSQRYGALVWSGDIDSTFEDLRRQICGGFPALRR